jgi:hypothetical protein
MFEDDLSNFVGVASFVLALLTIFTAARAGVLGRLDSAPGSSTKRAAVLEAALTLLVLLATCGVIVSGIPLWVDSWDHASLHRKGALALAFIVSWPVMLGLAAWQIALLLKAVSLYGDLPSA